MSVACDGNLYSATVVDHFSTVFQNDDSLLKNLLSKNSIRLCCLGACQALTTLGICKIINDALEGLLLTTEQRLKIQLFVIDENETFKDVVRNTVKEANKSLDNVKLHCDFLQADLRKKFNEEVSRRIHKSHIVIMVKYCNQRLCSDNTFPQKLRRTLNKILILMKEGSCLFYLDDVGNECHSVIKEEVSANIDFSEIYSGVFDGNSKYSYGTSRKFHGKNQLCNPQLKKRNNDNGIEILATLCTIWVKLLCPTSKEKKKKITEVKTRKPLKVSHLTENELPRQNCSNPPGAKAKKLLQVSLSSEKVPHKEDYIPPSTKAENEGKISHLKDEKEKKNCSAPPCSKGKNTFQVRHLNEKKPPGQDYSNPRCNKRKVVHVDPRLKKVDKYRNAAKSKGKSRNYLLDDSD